MYMSVSADEEPSVNRTASLRRTVYVFLKANTFLNLLKEDSLKMAGHNVSRFFYTRSENKVVNLLGQ